MIKNWWKLEKLENLVKSWKNKLKIGKFRWKLKKLENYVKIGNIEAFSENLEIFPIFVNYAKKSENWKFGFSRIKTENLSKKMNKTLENCGNGGITWKWWKMAE